MHVDQSTVVEVERRRLRSLIERDMSVANQLHSDDYQLITPTGESLTKAAYLADVEAKRIEYLVFEPASKIETLKSVDTVVLRYIARVVLSVNVADELEFRAWHTDVYQLRDRAWVAVWSQATRIRSSE